MDHKAFRDLPAWMELKAKLAHKVSKVQLVQPEPLALRGCKDLKAQPVQMDIEASLGGIIGVTAVTGRTAKNLLGQSVDCRVVELDRRIGFQECGKTPSEVCERTFRRRKRYDGLGFRGPVKI